MREKPSRETSLRKKPFDKEEIIGEKDVPDHIHKHTHNKKDIKNWPKQYTLEQIQQMIIEYVNSLPKPKELKSYNELEDKPIIPKKLSELTYDLLNDDTELKNDLKDILDRLEKVESHYHEDIHKHKNIEVLNKLDPSYFKTNADQFEMIITAINKMILISHSHKNIELLETIDNDFIIKKHNHKNENIIDKFVIENEKLMFEGKEVYLKEIIETTEELTQPKKSFFKRLFNKGD
jgi:hypothetical protein